jgi:hypothetical protein
MRTYVSRHILNFDKEKRSSLAESGDKIVQISTAMHMVRLSEKSCFYQIRILHYPKYNKFLKKH